MLAVALILGFHTEGLWYSEPNRDSERSLVFLTVASASEDSSATKFLTSTCSQNVLRHISQLFITGFVICGIAWAIFMGTIKMLEPKPGNLRWGVSMVLAALALVGVSLCATAMISFNNCEVIEVNQLHDGLKPLEVDEVLQ